MVTSRSVPGNHREAGASRTVSMRTGSLKIVKLKRTPPLPVSIEIGISDIECELFVLEAFNAELRSDSLYTTPSMAEYAESRVDLDDDSDDS